MTGDETEQAIALANQVMDLCAQAQASDPVGIQALVMATATVGLRLGLSVDQLRKLMHDFVSISNPTPVPGGNVIAFKKPGEGA